MAITDYASYPPASTGSLNYNAVPNIGVSTALGSTYTDTVFGETVRRMTNFEGSANESQHYSFHIYNADGTLMFRWQGGFAIVDTSNASTVYTGQPSGVATEVRWSMTNPDRYYFRVSTHLVARSLSSQANTTLKTFPAVITGAGNDLGGTANYQSSTDRYFIVRYNSSTKVWDSSTDTIFTGHASSPGNWTGYSPSGKFIVSSNDGEHNCYAVDLAGASVSTVPVNCYGFGGDHGGIISASDGKDYFVMQNNDIDDTGHFAFYCSTANSGTQAQQLANGVRLTNTSSNYDHGFHCSPVTRGEGADWIFISSEEEANTGNGDSFSDANFATEWRRLRQEIFAMNVVTGSTRRLVHHRSRGDLLPYWDQPRPSGSPTGNMVAWASNMNVSSPSGYADIYQIADPLGLTGGGGASSVIRGHLMGLG